MTYTFRNFCSDAHNAIALDNNHIGHEKVRQKLAFLLKHPEFISKYLLKLKTSKVTLYHEKNMAFISWLILGCLWASHRRYKYDSLGSPG
ncbi:MAG: hypothetical protein CMM53_08465 [Rhodospirillaceae bacterium]|nr:hypothetical protein [Rhodospirillaceae bacterium]